jgi:hypothetical protein
VEAVQLLLLVDEELEGSGGDAVVATVGGGEAVTTSVGGGEADVEELGGGEAEAVLLEQVETAAQLVPTANVVDACRRFPFTPVALVTSSATGEDRAHGSVSVVDHVFDSARFAVTWLSHTMRFAQLESWPLMVPTLDVMKA